MEPATLKSHLQATPFVPFVIHAPDRPRAEVPHPDFAALSPNGETLIVFLQEGGQRTFDTQLITEIEPLQPA